MDIPIKLAQTHNSTYVGVTYPAAISYMNVHKDPITSPVPNTITSMELDTNAIVSWDSTLDGAVSYTWNMYPKNVLMEFMNENRIGALTRALADHAADELSTYFPTMARNLFNNIGSPDAVGGRFLLHVKHSKILTLESYAGLNRTDSLHPRWRDSAADLEIPLPINHGFHLAWHHVHLATERALR